MFKLGYAVGRFLVDLIASRAVKPPQGKNVLFALPVEHFSLSRSFNDQGPATARAYHIIEVVYH